MDPSREQAALLQRCNIRPTYPRIKVLAYLMTGRAHPTADEIYSSLVREIPSLSKMTVYNTLKLLAQAKLIRVVNIGDKELRYDAIMTKHGHFKCDSCGVICDFPVDSDAIAVEGLDGCTITEKDVLVRGLCPQCTGKQKERAGKN